MAVTVVRHRSLSAIKMSTLAGWMDDDEEKQVDHLGGTGLGGLCREREEEAEECEADEE